jgi:putative Ig domain-containing protein
VALSSTSPTGRIALARASVTRWGFVLLAFPRPAGDAEYDGAHRAHKGRRARKRCNVRGFLLVATIGRVRGTRVALLVMLVFGAAAGNAATPSLQHVTMIGDSVADGVANDNSAMAILRQGVALDMEAAACRRVDQPSCFSNGVQPPNVVELANQMGSKLGPNVVVAVGYNDFEDQYAGNIESALAAFKAAGVKHVWWLTLRAAHHGYVTMNDDIELAAQNHPEMTVIDWNVYSRSHPEWFQSDGLHLLGQGSDAMATLIHTRLIADGVAVKPVSVTTMALPVAHHAKPYSIRLGERNGIPPYRWSLLERAPKGLHLLVGGRLEGKPLVKAGAYRLKVRVSDSIGNSATRSLTLRVTP